MKIKLFITGVISYVAMLFSFFYYSMAQSARTTPEYNIYRDAAMRHVDLLYNTNLHVDPAQINTYLGFFIISSVVLPLSNIIKTALTKLIPKEPLNVGPGVKTGLSIRIDNPTQLGSDLVVTAVAAIAAYPVPSIIIDMGTATTFSVINDKRQYIGGAIAPGAAVALNSLSSQTSQLPFISLEAPKHVIGSNTIDCMKSGSLFGNAAMIDGMIRRIRKELGENAIVVATGGIASAILPYCEENISYDPDLMLKGLALIYKKNQTR